MAENPLVLKACGKKRYAYIPIWICSRSIKPPAYVIKAHYPYAGIRRVKISEEALLNSGFSPAEIRKIKNNVGSYGGSLTEAIHDLANRFAIAAWVVSACVAVFIFLLIFGSSESIFSGGTGLLCGIAVAIFIQPPFIAYKSWRFRRDSRN